MKAFVTAFTLLLITAGTASAQGNQSVFGSSVESGFTLKGYIHLLNEGTNSLPDFSGKKPVGSIYAKELNIPKRNFEEGFPGVTDRYEWFAIDYRGVFYVDTPGRYRFRLTSDDGSRLYIDEKEVIDNDGQHEARPVETAIALTKGIHNIRVTYFQGPAVEIALVLEIAQGDGEFEIFNTDKLSPVVISNDAGDVHIVLGDAILFDTGASALKDEAQSVLAEIKSRTFDRHTDRLITIDGHTDDVGSENANLTLSLKRAQAVADWLVANGIAADRVQAVGYGDSRPRCDGTSESDRACNRRVEIRLAEYRGSN